MTKTALAALALLAGCTPAGAPPTKQPDIAERKADEALVEAEELRGRVDEMEARLDRLENQAR